MPAHMSTSYNSTCWKLVLGFYLFQRQGGSVLHDIGHLTLKLRAGSLISTSYLKEQCRNYKFMSPHPTMDIDSPGCG